MATRPSSKSWFRSPPPSKGSIAGMHAAGTSSRRRRSGITCPAIAVDGGPSPSSSSRRASPIAQDDRHRGAIQKQPDFDLAAVPLDDARPSPHDLRRRHHRRLQRLSPPASRAAEEAQAGTALKTSSPLAPHRPGPLEGGMVDTPIQPQARATQIVYHHPRHGADPRETYGVIVYQAGHADLPGAGRLLARWRTYFAAPWAKEKEVMEGTGQFMTAQKDRRRSEDRRRSLRPHGLLRGLRL